VTSSTTTGTDNGAWFGLFLPQIRMSFDTILERVLAAEDAGFDSVWLMDHLVPPGATGRDVFEGWTLAGALAARTDKIRIGHLVTSDPLRHPAVLAKMAATVDVLSGGRLDFGIGWGSVAAELESFGLGAGSSRQRAARLGESLDIVSLMFSGERFDYAGEHFRLTGAIGRPVPAQAHVPVHIGGSGPRLTMPLVRAHADWWNCPSYAIDRLAELQPLAGGARVSVQHPVALVPSPKARADVLAVAERRFAAWGGLIAGNAAEVGAMLVTEARAGVNGFVLQFSDFGVPDTVRLFMDAVAPAVRAAAHR
jgi:alkanesulfonate monooxygenase SsuD/methylene tetrahydromethanopterin reductase-like flavin-dependent oxidoreductase (luciferase family)